MILAHMGEEIVPTLLAGGATTVSMLILAWRAWLNSAFDRLRRR